jgi:GntR family transcriptional regulator, transcriptional repressor for pyruvate dehydrogenase complex
LAAWLVFWGLWRISVPAYVNLTKDSSGDSRETLSTQTLHQMLGWLKTGSLKPGDKLPSQNELVEQIGVSRTGVREALQMMAVLNMIDIRPGLGCFVKAISPDLVIQADVLSILLEKEAIIQVVEARKIVEAGTAAMASERGTAEDFWKVEDVLVGINRALQRNESVAELSAEFHVTVAMATHNAVLTKLVKSFHQLMFKAGELLESRVENLQEFKRHELQSHRLLYEIIRQRDPQRSREAMIEHIEYTEAMILEAFQAADAVDLTPGGDR